MKKNILFITLSLLIVVTLSVLLYFYYNNKKDEEELKVSDIDTEVDVDDTVIDWSEYEEITLNDTENGVNITKDGIYTLSGDINGQIRVKTSGNVLIELDDVNIKSSNGPAILVEEANNVVISLKDGSKNYIEDSKDYPNSDEEATIYSHDDLFFEGNGYLKVIANYQDAIVSSDDLTINSGTYEITSVDDGIRGKDSLHIVSGDFTIDSSGDGLKSSNDKDTNKGSILIENGTFKIVSDLDGVQSANKIVINNGTFDITTGGGSVNSSTTSSNWGAWGRNNKVTTDTNSESAKGIKAENNIVINDGTFTLDTSDDAIHSNNYVGVAGGTFKIKSGDDGVHADATLVIDNGKINIEESYEGLEAESLTINGGEIEVVASDDGVNAAGGNDSSGLNRKGANNFKSGGSSKLTINGGTIKINSQGDGLDANGSIYINGGTIRVDGPTNSGNGAIDYDQEFVVTGGEIVAVGASGMAQGISDSSKQNGVLINLGNSYLENSKIELVDSNNKQIVEYTSGKSFSSILVSSEKLEKGETYTLLINDEEVQEFKIDKVNTTIGNSMGNPMDHQVQMNPGGRPDGQGKRPRDMDGGM